MVTKALKVVQTSNLAASPLDGVSLLITAWKDYKNTCETERTKRSGIAADRDIRLKAIQEQATAVRTMIERTFSERAKNFDQYFALLNTGFASGNDKQIDVALTMIVEQTKVSPMVQAVQLMNSINDPNVDVIEI